MRAFDIAFAINAILHLLPYTAITVGIGIASLSVALCLGLLLAILRLCKNKIANIVGAIYVYIARCTPSLVLLFIVFYGIPQVIYAITGVYLYKGRAVYVIIALGLLSAANMCEILRSAFLSIDNHQYLAALSLGLKRRLAIRLVIAPQAALLALPNIVNSFSHLLKQGALSYTIGVMDLMGQGNLIVMKNFGAYGLETYLALAVIFWLLNIAVESLSNVLETKLEQGKKHEV